jgi:hypothetical protein
MAMSKRRGLCPLVLGVLIGAWGLVSVQAQQPKDATFERMRKDVTYLASDKLEGRGVSTQGINLAADHIAAEFKKAGLKPAMPDGSFFQPFPINGPGELSQPNRLLFQGPQGQTVELKRGDHFQVMGLSGSGKVTAPVVFAGFGITAPNASYDDFALVDVKGKVVIIVRKTPRFENQRLPFDGEMQRHHAALVTKLVNAGLHEAAAVLFVNDRHDARRGDRLMPFAYTAGEGSAGKLPAVHVHRSVVDTLVQSSLGMQLSDLERDIDGDLKPRSAPLAGWTATVEINVKRTVIRAKNVVGVLEGSGPLAQETVVIGAHYDHLGYGGSSSLAKDPRKKQIHHGADDNGSGTTALLELARRFGQAPGGPRRRLVFIAFSGEEIGLLGSEYYCKHPLFPLSDTVTMVNLDMVGRLRHPRGTPQERLEVFGTGTSKEFSILIDEVNRRYHFQLSKVASGIGPSDHSSFYMKKVPVFFFTTGSHIDYHKPSDTADKINVPGMAKVTDLIEDLVKYLSTVTKRPQYVYVKGVSQTGRGPAGPRLRFMPAYGEDEQDGLLIGDVVEKGPADKAGLKAGDRIIILAGNPVKNIQTFMVLMRTQKVGQPVEITFLRKGKKITVKAIPE